MSRLASFIFYHVARLLSYAIGVALSSAISAILAYVFVIYFADATHIPINDIMLTTLLAAGGFAWTMHSLHAGILHPLGFSGFTRDVRLLNKSTTFANGKISLKEGLTSQEYLRLLKFLSAIPFRNAALALIWAVAIGVAFLTVGVITSAFAPTDYTIVLIAGLIAFLLHGGFSLVIAEIASGPLRAETKRILHLKKIDYEDRHTTNVRFKLFMFLVLFAVTLYVSNVLTYTAAKEDRKIFGAIVFGAISVLIAMFMAYLIFSIIYQSLKEIEAAAAEFKKGGDGSLYPRSLDKEFINVAGGLSGAIRTIRDYQQNLEKKVEDRTAQLQQANEELSQKDTIMQMELDFAADIQKGIIPSHVPEWNGLRMAAHWRAMEKVSGDFYDIFPTQGNRYGVLIADVSGHGVPAALITTMAKVSFAKASSETFHPSEIFKKVNDQLFGMINTQDYLTAFLLSFDETHQFLYSNASHQLAKIWRKATGTIEELDTNGLFIGAIEDAGVSYEEKENKLYPGDKIILYTDGVVEYRNEAGYEYGHDRFEGVITEFANLPVDALVAKMVADLKEFAGTEAPQDDISMLVLEADANYGLFLEKMAQAQQFMEQNDRNQAVVLYDEALKLYPQNLNSLRTAGLVNYELGRIEKAVEYFQRYIEINTQNAEIYYWISLIYYKLGRLELSIMNGKSAVNLRPSYAEAWNTIGLASFKAKQIQDAKQAFEKALQFDPDNEVLRKNLQKVSSLVKKKG